MNGYKLFAKVTAVGMFVGVAGAAISQAALAYADDPLAGSDTAIILGGTGEARALADALAPRPDLQIITSLAGRTVAPRLPRGELRVGGFGRVILARI